MSAPAKEILRAQATRRLCAREGRRCVRCQQHAAYLGDILDNARATRLLEPAVLWDARLTAQDHLQAAHGR